MSSGVARSFRVAGVLLAVCTSACEAGAGDGSGRRPQEVAAVSRPDTSQDAALASAIDRSGAAVRARYRGRTLDEPTVAGGRAAAVVAAAVRAFSASDEGYRLVVTPALLAGIERDESFVRITFSTPLTVSPAARANPVTVRSLLVPLSGKWAEGTRTFFYEDAARDEWFALRWSSPESPHWTHLLDSLDQAGR